MKTFFCFLICVVYGSKSIACTPIASPNLATQSFSAGNLVLNWESYTVWNCPGYFIEVEITCCDASFMGAGPFFITDTILKTTTPQAYPQQTISLAMFCPGTVYQFRARERQPNLSSNWTSTFTFTTPGIFLPPVLNLFAAQNPIGCAVQFTQLGATLSSGCGADLYLYNWQPTIGLSCITCSDRIASPSIATTYTCLVTPNKFACWTASNSITISFLNAISVSITPGQGAICAGEAAYLNAAGAATYTWSTNANGNTIAVTPIITTSYSVIGISTNGCIDSAYYTQPVFICTSIASQLQDNSEFKIYPNPSGGMFRIEAAGNIDIDIMNELGEIVKQLSLNSTNNYQYEVKRLLKGIYFVADRNSKTLAHQKIVITD